MKLFVNDLTVIDSTFLCPDRGLVGESWIVDIELAGQLNQMNMLFDFGLVKKTIKRIIDENVDHKLLIPRRSPQCSVSPLDADGRIGVSFMRPEQRHIQLCCPQQAFCFIDCIEITEAAIIKYVVDVLTPHMPDNISGLTIKLRNEQIEGPYYHYSHGLKKHDGNCQRIAHGHRSMLEIFIDDEADEELAASWAMKWRNVYLGSQEDECPLADLSFNPTLAHNDSVGFAYQAPQGFFELLLPRAECDLLPCDTTVENLAYHIASSIKQSHPQQEVRVHAYEGVGKGAIAVLA
ncbi:6-pyruvoyl trahydropterin synthase family protein [Celerinatantimonas sp. YJH-8]|uniref:6-pyruvoyl trahydropterin synthase family protein n=1 Tax=Celerinatantimonas sp. YJH-8 TaxID=3228714 RepID=UPI0038C2329D